MTNILVSRCKKIVKKDVNSEKGRILQKNTQFALFIGQGGAISKVL